MPPVAQGQDTQWTPDPYFKTTYDPCKALSFVVLTVPGSTGSTPSQVMLFHSGKYLGTATANAFIVSDVQQVSDDSIQVTFRDSIKHGSDGLHLKYAPTTFTYTGGKVAMTNFPADMN